MDDSSSSHVTHQSLQLLCLCLIVGCFCSSTLFLFNILSFEMIFPLIFLLFLHACLPMQSWFSVLLSRVLVFLSRLISVATLGIYQTAIKKLSFNKIIAFIFLSYSKTSNHHAVIYTLHRHLFHTVHLTMLKVTSTTTLSFHKTDGFTVDTVALLWNFFFFFSNIFTV